MAISLQEFYVCFMWLVIWCLVLGRFSHGLKVCQVRIQVLDNLLELLLSFCCINRVNLVTNNSCVCILIAVLVGFAIMRIVICILRSPGAHIIFQFLVQCGGLC